MAKSKLYQDDPDAKRAWEAVTTEQTVLNIDLDRVTFLAASATEEVMVTVRHKATNEYFYKGEEEFETDDPFAGMFDDESGKIKRTKKVKFRNKTEFYGLGKAIGGRLCFINQERELQGLEPYEKSDFEVIQSYEPKDIKYLHKAVDGMINSILDFFGKDHFVGWLGHGHHLNRHDIESLIQYKETRKGERRPTLLSECHEYTIKKYKPNLVSDIEVDDMMTRIQFAGYQHFVKHGWYDQIAICTDKDSHQTAGCMFDWMKDKKVFVYPMPRQIPHGLGYLEKQVKKSGVKIFGLGRKFLYKQLLTGDTTDGFSPTAYWKDDFKGRKLVHNVDRANLKNGEITAYNLLVDCKTDKECWQVIVDTYKSWFPDTIKYISWSGKHITTNYIGILQQTASAAFMQRVPNDKLDVCKTLTKLGIEYEWLYEVSEAA